MCCIISIIADPRKEKISQEKKTKQYLNFQGMRCEQCNNTENCFLCGAGWPEKVEDCTGCEGNSCFNGYCIDLVRKISEVV